jgi:multidrug efflux pump subunit AcrA (membrane-fusion protein)
VKKEGTAVNKGDTIIKLDYMETLLDAERCRVIAESDAELQAAKLKAATAEKDYEATRTLHDSTRAISGEELWKKELEYNLTKTERDRLTMVKSKEVIEYKMSLDRLNHYFVITPFNGIIAQSFLFESETCKPQEPLIKLVDIARCRFITYVPAIFARDLTKGKKVTIFLEGGKTPLTREGTIEFIAPVVDPSSGLRTVKIIFDNLDGSVQPGVKGSLIISSSETQ